MMSEADVKSEDVLKDQSNKENRPGEKQKKNQKRKAKDKKRNKSEDDPDAKALAVIGSKEVAVPQKQEKKKVENCPHTDKNDEYSFMCSTCRIICCEDCLKEGHIGHRWCELVPYIPSEEEEEAESHDHHEEAANESPEEEVHVNTNGRRRLKGGFVNTRKPRSKREKNCACRGCKHDPKHLKRIVPIDESRFERNASNLLAIEMGPAKEDATKEEGPVKKKKKRKKKSKSTANDDAANSGDDQKVNGTHMEVDKKQLINANMDVGRGKKSEDYMAVDVISEKQKNGIETPLSNNAIGDKEQVSENISKDNKIKEEVQEKKNNSAKSNEKHTKKETIPSPKYTKEKDAVLSVETVTYSPEVMEWNSDREKVDKITIMDAVNDQMRLAAKHNNPFPNHMLKTFLRMQEEQDRLNRERAKNEVLEHFRKKEEEERKEKERLEREEKMKSETVTEETQSDNKEIKLESQRNIEGEEKIQSETVAEETQSDKKEIKLESQRNIEGEERMQSKTVVEETQSENKEVKLESQRRIEGEEKMQSESVTKETKTENKEVRLESERKIEREEKKEGKTVMKELIKKTREVKLESGGTETKLFELRYENDKKRKGGKVELTDSQLAEASAPVANLFNNYINEVCEKTTRKPIIKPGEIPETVKNFQRILLDENSKEEIKVTDELVEDLCFYLKEKEEAKKLQAQSKKDKHDKGKKKRGEHLKHVNKKAIVEKKHETKRPEERKSHLDKERAEVRPRESLKVEKEREEEKREIEDEKEEMRDRSPSNVKTEVEEEIYTLGGRTCKRRTVIKGNHMSGEIDFNLPLPVRFGMKEPGYDEDDKVERDEYASTEITLQDTLAENSPESELQMDSIPSTESERRQNIKEDNFDFELCCPTEFCCVTNLLKMNSSFEEKFHEAFRVGLYGTSENGNDTSAWKEELRAKIEKYDTGDGEFSKAVDTWLKLPPRERLCSVYDGWKKMEGKNPRKLLECLAPTERERFVKQLKKVLDKGIVKQKQSQNLLLDSSQLDGDFFETDWKQQCLKAENGVKQIKQRFCKAYTLKLLDINDDYLIAELRSLSDKDGYKESSTPILANGCVKFGEMTEEIEYVLELLDIDKTTFSLISCDTMRKFFSFSLDTEALMKRVVKKGNKLSEVLDKATVNPIDWLREMDDELMKSDTFAETFITAERNRLSSETTGEDHALSYAVWKVYSQVQDQKLKEVILMIQEGKNVFPFVGADRSALKNHSVPEDVYAVCPIGDNVWVHKVGCEANTLMSLKGQSMRELDFGTSIEDFTLTDRDLVLASDPWDHRILCMEKPDQFKDFVTFYNLMPLGIEWTMDQNLLVCLVENYYRYDVSIQNRRLVAKVSPAGEFLMTIEWKPSKTERWFNVPRRVVEVTTNKDIVVVDRFASNRGRVLMFDKCGEFKHQWAGHFEICNKPFDPRDVEVDSNGRLFVCDYSNNVILLFDLDYERIKVLSHDNHAQGLCYPMCLSMNHRNQLWIGCKFGKVMLMTGKLGIQTMECK